jgi:hypothetical protein
LGRFDRYVDTVNSEMGNSDDSGVDTNFVESVVNDER